MMTEIKSYNIYVLFWTCFCFTIGLFNFVRLTKSEKEGFLSFHCNTQINKFYLVIFPIVIINFGFICIMFRYNIEKTV